MPVSIEEKPYNKHTTLNFSPLKRPYKNPSLGFDDNLFGLGRICLVAVLDSPRLFGGWKVYRNGRNINLPSSNSLYNEITAHPVVNFIFLVGFEDRYSNKSKVDDAVRSGRSHDGS